ncbi:hypothetical protein EYZ11_006604 [Aspergillus tanneri]|uniref:Uncharacterized protein n=1 Tax=Aspergillus tanneri TaxID=1220188 RepID=A0A4S3JFD9_9EURO|nr:hypothetical protein EYZ11_006604 [Aspergillus tanneri]
MLQEEPVYSELAVDKG